MVESSEGLGHPGLDWSTKRATFVGALLAAFLLVAIPALTHTVYHPFADNFIFGWRYMAPSEYKTVYAIGYKRPDGTFNPLPRGHGGFIESRLNTTMDASAAVEAKSASPVPGQNPVIVAMLCAWRPTASNRWLLGPLALPEHRWSMMRDFDMTAADTLYLIAGTPNAEDLADKYRPVRVEWKPITSFKRPLCR